MDLCERVNRKNEVCDEKSQREMKFSLKKMDKF